MSDGPGNAVGGSQSTVEDADTKGEAEIRARRSESDDDTLDFLQPGLISPVRGRNRKPTPGQRLGVVTPQRCGAS